MTEKTAFKKAAIAAARFADSKKAESVSVYDMDGRSELADYVVVVTVDNPAQLEAVDEEISVNLKKEGLYALYRDGMRSKNWKVLDYGGIIVHIFEKQAREFYSLDKVYAGFSEVKWQEKGLDARPATGRKPQAASTRKVVVKKAQAVPKKVKAAPKKTKKPAAKKAAKKAPARISAPRKVTSRKPNAANRRKSAPKKR
jgi:ribosome-associated protein